MARYESSAVGGAIKAARERKGWSQGQLAAALDVSQQAVSNWEAGTTSRPKVEHMRVMWDLLDFSAEELSVFVRIYSPTAEGIGDGTSTSNGEAIAISASGVDLEELRREDPDAYDDVMELARRRRPHQIEVIVMGPDGGTVAKVEGGFQLEALDLEVGEQTQLPMALDLRNAGVSSYGAHQATVYIDGNSQDTLQFYVVPVDQPPT